MQVSGVNEEAEQNGAEWSVVERVDKHCGADMLGNLDILIRGPSNVFGNFLFAGFATLQITVLVGCPNMQSCFDWTVTVGQQSRAKITRSSIFFQNSYGKGFF